MEKMGPIRKVGVVIALLLMLYASGCAGRQAPAPMKALEIDVSMPKLENIGMARAHYLPHYEVQTPPKGAIGGAVEGAKIGSLYPIEAAAYLMRGCNDAGCALIGIAGLSLAPPGAVVGSVIGAVTVDSSQVVNEREIRIRNALTELRMQENMSEQFQSRMAKTKAFPVTVVDEYGPTVEGEKPDYRRLKANGIDTINEIDVQKLVLNRLDLGIPRMNPDFTVQLDVMVRLVSTTDNTELYSKVFTCSSQNDKFEEWAAQKAAKFRSAIICCYKDIAERSVKELYEGKELLTIYPVSNMLPCE